MLKDGDTLGILEGVPGVPALDDRVNGMLEGLGGRQGQDRRPRRHQLHRGAGPQRRPGSADGQSRTSRRSTRPAARRLPARRKAIKNAGIASDDIVLVGFDFCCGEAEALTAGIEDATVAQFPTKMAELGVDALVKAIRGEKVESLIDSGAALVTKDNMDQF